MDYFLPFLAIVFITLKLIGIIAWSWWLILLPLYAGLLLFFGLAGLVLLASAVVALFGGNVKFNKKK